MGNIKPGIFIFSLARCASKLKVTVHIVAFDIKPAQDVSLPSTETQRQQPGEHTGGIGTLPGSKDEQGVAVLPEERATKTETDRSERPEEQSEPSSKPKGAGDTGVGVSGATDLLKKETRSRVSTGPHLRGWVTARRSQKGEQRSHHLGEPTIQLEPRVHPFGDDTSRWHGTNFGRRAVEEWERAAASANVFTPLSRFYFPSPFL